MLAKTIFCLLGLVASVAGVFTLVKQYSLRKHCTAQVKGYVSFIPFKASSEKEAQVFEFMSKISKKITRVKSELTIRDAYSEVITYSIDGVEHVTPTGHVSEDTRKYSMGQSVVTVAYDPSDLNRFHILENRNDLYFGILTVILGPMFVGASFLIPK